MRPPAPQVRYDIQPYLSRIGKTLLNLIHIDGAFIVQVIEAALLFDLQYRAGGYCHVEERGSREIREHCPQLWGSLKLHHNTKCWLCPHPTLSVCQSPMKDTMNSKRSGNGREKNLIFYFSPINLYDSLVNQLKIEHFLPRLCSIVHLRSPPLNSTTTKLHCPMWNSFCTGSEFPSRCCVLCAQKHTKEFANNVRAKNGTKLSHN